MRRAVRDIEEALVPLGARPHWGKVFEMDADGAGARPTRGSATSPPCGTGSTRTRVFGNAFLDRVLPWDDPAVPSEADG